MTERALDRGVWLRPVPQPRLHDAAVRHVRRGPRHDHRRDLRGGGLVSAFEDWLAEQARRREDAGLTRRLVPRHPSEPVHRPGRQRLPRPGPAPARSSRGRSPPRRSTAPGRVPPAWSPARCPSTRISSERWPTSPGSPTALVFSTGYHANLSVVSALADADTLVVSDAHVHASLIDACRLSRADGDGRAAQRRRRSARVRWPAVPRPGHWCSSRRSTRSSATPHPWPTWPRSARRTTPLLVADEAHALGVAGVGGRGLLHAAGLGRPSRRGRHPDPEQVARRPGRSGALLLGRPGAPGQPGAAVHLRHRAGSRCCRRGAGGAGASSRPSRSGSRRVNEIAARLAEACRVGAPDRRRAGGADARPARGASPRSRRPPGATYASGASVLRPPPTGSPGSGSPPTRSSATSSSPARSAYCEDLV